MHIRGIRHELLSLLLELGRDSHPNEFVALLRERDGVIEELNMLPGTITGGDSASLFFDMMPLDTHLAGSAHSHPRVCGKSRQRTARADRHGHRSCQKHH